MSKADKIKELEENIAIWKKTIEYTTDLINKKTQELQELKAMKKE